MLSRCPFLFLTEVCTVRRPPFLISSTPPYSSIPVECIFRTSIRKGVVCLSNAPRFEFGGGGVSR